MATCDWCGGTGVAEPEYGLACKTCGGTGQTGSTAPSAFDAAPALIEAQGGPEAAMAAAREEMEITPAKGVGFHWSPQQEAIFGWFAHGKGNLCVRARAGTGKTTTIIEAINHAPERRILLAAFNKNIADELQARLRNPKAVAMTLHSLGRRFCMNGFRVGEPDTRRGYEIAKTVIMERDERHLFPKAAITKLVSKLAARLKNVKPLGASQDEAVRLALDAQVIPDDGTAWKVEHVAKYALRAMEAAKKVADGRIDFDDMLYLPLALDLCRGLYDLVVVDECQDMNPAQLLLARRALVPGGRLAVIGDDRQCAPPGCMVLMEGGVEKRIEDVRDGDRVVSFARHEKAMIGYKNGFSVHTSSRPYKGDLVVVGVAGRTTWTTPNHKWLVRWADRSDVRTCVTYMMRKGDRYRVGWCQLFSSDGSLHLSVRGNIEGADSLWILRAFSSPVTEEINHARTEASIYESIVATRYGLPTITFRPVDGANHLTAEAIESFFNAIGGEEHVARAQKCLRDHGRDATLPLWPPVGKEYGKMGRTTLFESYAANLEQGLMSVPIPEGRDVNYTQFETVSRSAYDGPVYSLEVEKHETYVQDGLVTHNSIYSFRGADSGSLDRIKEETSAKELSLTVTRRCPKKVVAYAKRLVPDFEAAPEAEGGEIADARVEQLPALAARGDFVLSRVNAPLMRLCLDFIRAGLPAMIAGKDIARELEDKIRSIAPDDGISVESFLTKLAAWESDMIRKLSSAAHDEEDDETRKRIEKVADTSETLRVLAEKGEVKTVQDLIIRLGDLFKEVNGDRSKYVWLSTVHKCKGLESERVFILRETLYCWWKRRDDQEERNIDYVAATRSRHELVWVTGLREKNPEFFAAK